MTPDDERPVGELADEYFSVVDEGPDRETLAEAEEEATELRERHERFADRYGESDPATRELADRLSSAEERVEQLKEQQSLPEELEEELLERAMTFMLTNEWLQPEVIEALNQALIGERDTSLVIEEIEIAGKEDVNDFDEPIRFDVIDIVRQLALDKLGRLSDIRDCWETLEGTTKEEPFRIVADIGGATPDEVLERVEADDVKRETVRGRLKNATQKDINPYLRQDGVYHLSTVGKYIALEYANVTEPDGEGGESPDDDPEDGQATLDQNSVAEGGGSDD